MLARAQRLRTSSDINRVYARGKYGSAQNLHIKLLKTGLPTSRVTIVVSKKVAKRAVIRNRIRRRVSALFEEVWQTLTGTYDIVVVIREDVSELPKADLLKQIRSSLVKVGAVSPADRN
jgi:ribonuclease P protein component